MLSQLEQASTDQNNQLEQIKELETDKAEVCKELEKTKQECLEIRKDYEQNKLELEKFRVKFDKAIKDKEDLGAQLVSHISQENKLEIELKDVKAFSLEQQNLNKNLENIKNTLSTEKEEANVYSRNLRIF